MNEKMNERKKEKNGERRERLEKGKGSRACSIRLTGSPFIDIFV